MFSKINQDNMTWLTYALGGALAASLGTIFAKIGLLKDVDSNVLTTVRGIVMAISVLLFTLTLGKFSIASLKEFEPKTWLFVLLSGLCGATSWLLFYYALAHGPASGVTAIDKLSIVITIVLAFVLLGERFTIQAGIGTLMIGIGALLVAVPWVNIKDIFK
jgi:bacterial/archaeal transporter family protein